jgi:hypothetical protein
VRGCVCLPACADGRGNPVGGLVFGNTFGHNQQYHEWTSFISDSEFCFRACVGPNAHINCQHIYDGEYTLTCVRLAVCADAARAQ